MRNLRRLFMLDPDVTFLNHGSFGAVPREVFREYQWWQRELERQPVEFLGRRFTGLMHEARSSLAVYIHTAADNVVFTPNVTVSINIVARSLELGADDEVLATNHEYGACDRTWRFLSKERGFRYIQQPIQSSFSVRRGSCPHALAGSDPSDESDFHKPHHQPDSHNIPCCGSVRSSPQGRDFDRC